MKEKFSNSPYYDLEMLKRYCEENESFRMIMKTLFAFGLIAGIGSSLLYYTDSRLYKNFRELSGNFYILDLYFDTNLGDLDADLSLREMGHKNSCSIDSGFGYNLLTFMLGCYENYIFFYAEAKDSSNLVIENGEDKSSGNNMR